MHATTACHWVDVNQNESAVKIKTQLKASSHIDDTTRHDSMRHDMIFRFPYNQMDQFTHMQHDQVWSSRQKAAATKIALEAIFVVCRSDSIKKTAKENSFHTNLTWVLKFMMQKIVSEVTIPSVLRYPCNSFMMSTTFRRHVKFDQSFRIRFLDRKFKNFAYICVERFLSFLTVIFICRSINCHGVCNKSLSSRMVVSWFC